MPDKLLLRFRDLVAPTIENHNTIAMEHGRVLWGWWKKPLEATPDPGLSNLAEEFRPGETTILLIDSATRRLYEAPLFKIYYEPGGKNIPAPTPELCPGYYRNQDLPAWFEIGTITPIPVGVRHLEGYVWSSSNRVSPMQSIASLPSRVIGEAVADIDFLDSNVSLWFVVPTEEVSLRQRSSVVPSYSKGVWPTTGHLILHISDLHFGACHAFRNQLARGVEAHLGAESMLEALLDDLDSIGVLPNGIAFVAITGDLTWRGEAHEFENALQMINEMCSKLGLHSSQVVVVPGNHDIEWRDEHGKIDENSELNFAHFSARLYGAPPEPQFFRIHRFRIGEKTITCIGLNSCRIEKKKNAGLGFVGRQQLGSVTKLLGAVPPDGTEVRIALVHHHLVSVNYVEEIDWDTKRVSLMLDAESVLRHLMSLGARLVCHGHQHQPFIAEERRIIAGYVDPVARAERPFDGRIVVVGGGSLGVDRAHLNTIGRNAYNLIDVSSDPERISIRTRVRSPAGPGFVDYHQVVV